MKRVAVLVFFLTFPVLGWAESTCPTGEFTYCFQCTGLQSYFACCPDPSSPTGYMCKAQACNHPLPVDCPEDIKEEFAVLQAMIAAVESQLTQCTAEAKHPDGQFYSAHWEAAKATVQLYKDHYAACAKNNFQLWMKCGR